MGNRTREYCVYFGQATEVWKRYVIREIIVAFDEYRDSVCQTLQDTDNSGPSVSPGGVNNQEMFGAVLENAQQRAEQRIVNSLIQTLNQPLPVLHFPGASIIANQTDHVNSLGQRAIYQAGVNSVQNHNDHSLDVSIKSEVDSSSESECESDTDDEEVQVKEEPNDDEDITGRSEEQTENANNSNDIRETNDSQNDNSTKAANDQESNGQAMMIDEEEANLEEDPNGPIIIVVQYSSPPSSPSNAEPSINPFEFNSHSNDDNQINMNENEIASDDEIGHVEAEGNCDDDLKVDDSVALMSTDAQQQVTVPTAVNSNTEQVDNSVNSNFENLNESEAMDCNDENAVDEQSDAQAILDESFVDEALPTVDSVSLPSTSTGRRLSQQTLSTRSKKRVNHAETDEYSIINRNRKRTIPFAGELSTHKRVAVEPVVVAHEDEEVGIEAPLTVIVRHLNCPEAGCTEECPDKDQLDRHLLSKHQIMEFRCKVKDCGLSFAYQSELTDHHKLAHRNLKDWPCAKCETTCKSYRKLSKHFGHCHEEGEFECSADKCTFTGKTRLQVRHHYQYKHGPAKYECTFADCTASFKQKPHLTAHLRRHNQERPFACEECTKAFTTKRDLTLHQRVHSGLKPYRCKWPGCDASAKQSGNVYTHVRVHHFGLPGTKKEQTERGIIDTRDAREFVEKITSN